MKKEMTLHINWKRGLFLALFFCVISFSSPQAASTIQSELDVLQANEHFILKAGVYKENLVITKPVTIQSEGKVEWQGTIEVAANNVKIEGITFSGEQGIIAKKVKNVEVVNNIFRTKKQPIYFDGVQDSMITDVEIIGAQKHYSKNVHGISVFNSTDITMRNNKITYTQDGIYLENSQDIVAENNEMAHGRYGIHVMYGGSVSVRDNRFQHYVTGVMSMVAEDVEVAQNDIRYQHQLNSTGITIYQTKDVEIHHNTIAENSIAIQLQQVKDIYILENIFSSNQLVLKNYQPTNVLFEQNELYANVLIASSGHKGITLQGNSFDDYAGNDFDGDGYGDEAYVATSTFGKWVLKNEHYQYFIGSTATDMLEKMDHYSKHNTLIDEKPMIKQNESWKFGFSPGHFTIGLLLLIGLIYAWRKLK